MKRIFLLAVLLFSGLAYAADPGAQFGDYGSSVGLRYMFFDTRTGSGGASLASLGTLPQGTVIAGPSTYGAAAAAGTARALVAADLPADTTGRTPNAIQSGPVDGSGYPNHLATAASTAALPINGGTTPLVMDIAGKPMTLNTNVTVTLTTGHNFIYALGDTVNANLVQADFIASLIPLSYTRTAPACSNGANVSNGLGGFAPAASASVPHYWFNMATGQMNLCTSSGGSFTATSYGGGNAPAIEIGVAFYDGTSIQAVGQMPFAASPLRITQNFGDGSSGAMLITSAGTTTKDGIFNFTALEIATGTLQGGSSAQSPGLIAYSQNPVENWNGVLSAGTSRTQTAPGTGIGAAGLAGGIAGNGGGGGGTGATAGGQGGSRAQPQMPGANTGGGGAGTTGIGGTGTNANNVGTVFFSQPMIFCSGSTGGNGAGDGVNNGGQGATAPGYLLVRAPNISLAGTGVIKANGITGSNGAGGNAAGGGGSGGGCAFAAAFAQTGIVAGTNLTATGGSGGAGVGTGTAGGPGGTGLAAFIPLQ